MTAPYTVEIRTRTIGMDEPASPLDTILLEMLVEKITLRELIARTVEEQVRELLIRRRLKAEEASPILHRQYMTPAEIAEQAASGAVRYPSARTAAVPALDTATEVKHAWRAFERGAYVASVDGRRIERLSDEILFKPGTRITFLRLMPLKGG